MRNVLQTPLPKVYAWSCEADNPVKAEYIIMEKVAGVPLDSVWSSMELEHRWAVAKKIAQYQQSWLASPFHGYGSLYFTKDLHNHESLPVQGFDNQYAIGPTTGGDWSNDHRLNINFSRGPCKFCFPPTESILALMSATGSNEVSYLQAIADRETQCIRELRSLPKSPITLCGPGTYQPTKERKLLGSAMLLQAPSLPNPS